ncbi:MAG: NAD-dependent dehydratase [Proteobacteria bacterium]|nr:NAD-dependent dehydratase [Pseudomonadota bacterium]
MSRILVTGGAGFLGSHLCEALLARGSEVICLDNCSTGSEENVQHLLENASFSFINHDIITPIEVRCDEIYNLACPASPIHYQKDPINTFKTSVTGAINLLDLARAQGAKILQASTSEIYGDPKEHPQKEGYFGNVNPIGIRACYDEGKRGAETLFFDFARKYDVDIKVVRIFNTYGPRMSLEDGRVVSGFVVQALNQEPLTIFGDGSQTRSFCYVDDLVEGFVRMMVSESSVKGPINLGNPGEFTVLELANLVIKLTGSSSPIEFRDLPQDDPTRRRPDISLASNILKWQPEVPLRDGLLKTIEYFKSKLNGTGLF